MAEDKEAKVQALKVAIEQIEKQHGKGSIMRLNDGPIMKIDAISTGSISLDAALGIGGVPRGRVIEIYGPESSGKTTICLHIIAEAQKTGGICAFIDAEHALDTGYARKLGVDTSSLLLSQPEYGEQALEIVETLVRSGAIDVVVVDSVAALTPRAEIEGEMGDPTMGVHARLMSQALRKLTSAISKSKTTVMFTTADKPGALVEVLFAFQRSRINLSHIEKRPSGRRNWTYTFFVDCLGHRDDPPMVKALEEARAHCRELQVVGSYPRSKRIL